MLAKLPMQNPFVNLISQLWRGIRSTTRSATAGFWTFACFCALSFAQTPDIATIRGHVIDASKAGIVGAQITATNPSIGIRRSAETNTSGEFTLAGLPIGGSYELVVSKPGFSDSRVSGLILASGTAAEVSIQMAITAGQTTVTVTGVVGEVRADQPQIGIDLGRQEIQDTPLPNRRISYLPLLNAANRPAINQGDVFMNQNLFTTNGAGRRQTWFEVDGSSANDSWGRQTIFSNIPVDAVEEMTVLSNAFSAEFGGGTGSVVNVVTRSGASHLHGDVDEVWRPAETEASLSGFTASNAASGNDITSDTLGQSAFYIGGPLASNSTHFSTAAEFSRQDRASPVISPVAPGSFVGHYRGWLAFLRVDHQINERNTIFLRVNVDGFHDTNPNGTVGGNTLPTVDRVFRRRTYSEEIGATSTLSPTMLNNARIQFQLASPITQFDPANYGTQFQVPISAGGTFTTGTSQAALLMNRQYQATDTISGAWGAHQVKLGADVIVAHSGGNSKEFGGPIYLGQFIYKSCTQALAVCESTSYLNNIANVASYTQSYGNASYKVDDTLWSIFLQDDYRVRRNLTLNIGFRYEQQTFTDSRLAFAPRAGFSYNWGGDGNSVIRSGFGIYYSQITDNSEANYALTGPTGVFNYTATPGQIGFPLGISQTPLPAFPVGAQTPLRSLYVRPGESAYLDQFFPTSTLVGYPAQLLNPYSKVWTAGIERRIHEGWVLSVDYVGSHTTRINRPRDVDPPSSFVRTTPGQVRSAQAANCSRPFWIWWYGQHGLACNSQAATNPQPPYAVIQSDVNDGYANYDALDVNLRHQVSHRLSMLASYTWSHASDTVDPDIPSQNPNDANSTGRVEYGNAIFDQRHRFVLSGVFAAPGKIQFGGFASLASGLPFNFVTGVNNSGDTGATTDRPVIGGAVIGRNAGRGRPIYDASPFIERPFSWNSERLTVLLRVEAFNIFNHANYVGYSGTYGNGAAPGAGFGAPLVGVTNQLPARSLQFSARVSF